MSAPKRCRKCDVELVVGETCAPSRLKRRNYTCRECANDYDRAWRAANPEKRWESRRAWRAANPERARGRVRAWRGANPARAAFLIAMANARTRSRKKGLLYDLTEYRDQLWALFLLGCSLTGMPFSFVGGMTFDSPSLDRIVPERGYVWGNVRWVWHGLNCAAGTWGIERALEMTDLVRAHQAKADGARLN
jgi:hypothetical protein